MPILDVELVLGEGEKIPPGTVQRIADAAGAVLESGPGRVWVRLRRLAITDYAENGGLAEGVRPTFVTVLVARLPDRSTPRAEAERLAVTIADACSRPRENVHILYLPEAAGRIAFGGALLED